MKKKFYETRVSEDLFENYENYEQIATVTSGIGKTSEKKCQKGERIGSSPGKGGDKENKDPNTEEKQKRKIEKRKVSVPSQQIAKKVKPASKISGLIENQRDNINLTQNFDLKNIESMDQRGYKNETIDMKR